MNVVLVMIFCFLILVIVALISGLVIFRQRQEIIKLKKELKKGFVLKGDYDHEEDAILEEE